MIELSKQQRQELESGRAVEVTDDLIPCVVLRKDVYDRMKHLLYDDSEWTPEEQLRVLADSGLRAGWDDPLMDVYDDYDTNHKKLCP